MKLLKMKILAGLMISTIYAGTAQNPKQANIWYFGINAGLDFTQGNPAPLTNGSMESFEGIATICDDDGNLMFYTNGGNQPFTGAVWNRNHQVMPNGYLENAAGCSSSLQSSIIVKKPGEQKIYYLFTTDCYENSFENGISYSIVDMNLNGGTGDIVVKGQKIGDNVSESLTAAAHANGKDYWIITHQINSDSFFVYHLTRDGIAGVVKTKVGPVANEFAAELKVSANGERLAFGGSSFCGIFDFDAGSGVISNHRDLGVHGAYVTFSPDCKLLYVVEFINRRIFQFDMLAYNIKATKTLIGTSTDYIGQMQVGPDNKIYVAIRNSQYIGVIARPNIKGVNCNFIKNDIYLNGKTCKYGLPNYPNNVLGECGSYPVENVTKYEPQFLVNNLSPKQIVLELNPSPDATEYRISRKEANSSRWENFTTNSNIIVNDNLNENTEYEFRLDAVVYPDHTYEFIYDHNFEDVTKDRKEARTFKASTSNGFDFDIYPNPAKEKATVEMYLKKNSPVEILITDLGGKVIFHNNLEGKSGFQRFDLPLDNINSGIYQLSLKCGSMNGYKKLVIID